MNLEDRLRQMVSALPNEASIMLPLSVVRDWLEEEGSDPLDDLTVAQVAAGQMSLSTLSGIGIAAT